MYCRPIELCGALVVTSWIVTAPYKLSYHYFARDRKFMSETEKKQWPKTFMHYAVGCAYRYRGNG